MSDDLSQRSRRVLICPEFLFCDGLRSDGLRSDGHNGDTKTDGFLVEGRFADGSSVVAFRAGKEGTADAKGPVKLRVGI